MTKNEYPHFNPKNYDIDVKIATVRTSSHSKHNVFEYSIFGDEKGTSKIGDFTQKKLKEW